MTIASWDEAVGLALKQRESERQGWGLTIEAEPIKSIDDCLNRQPAKRFEFLGRLTHGTTIIPAWQWIGEISQHHPDRLRLLDYGTIKSAINFLRSEHGTSADVNVSAAILAAADFPRWISQEIANVGTSRLRLDVDVRIPLSAVHIRTLESLRQNFLVALDDYGDRAGAVDLLELRPNGIKASARILEEINNEPYGKAAFMGVHETGRSLEDSGFPHLRTVYKGVSSLGVLNNLRRYVPDTALIQGRLVQ